MFDPIVGNGFQYRKQERARLAKAATLCAGCPARTKCTSVTVAVTVEAVIPAPATVAQQNLNAQGHRSNRPTGRAARWSRQELPRSRRPSRTGCPR